METAYPTKHPVRLFYRDPIECIQSLLHSPLVKDYIHFTPLRIFETAEKLVRVYNNWLTGDAAWRIQVSLFTMHISFLINLCYRVNYHQVLPYSGLSSRLTRPIFPR